MSLDVDDETQRKLGMSLDDIISSRPESSTMEEANTSNNNNNTTTNTTTSNNNGKGKKNQRIGNQINTIGALGSLGGSNDSNIQPSQKSGGQSKGCWVSVSGIPPGTGVSPLRNFFKRGGRVLKVDTRRLAGPERIVTVQYSTREEALSAIKTISGLPFSGSILTVTRLNVSNSQNSKHPPPMPPPIPPPGVPSSTLEQQRGLIGAAPSSHLCAPPPPPPIGWPSALRNPNMQLGHNAHSMPQPHPSGIIPPPPPPQLNGQHRVNPAVGHVPLPPRGLPTSALISQPHPPLGHPPLMNDSSTSLGHETLHESAGLLGPPPSSQRLPAAELTHTRRIVPMSLLPQEATAARVDMARKLAAGYSPSVENTVSLSNYNRSAVYDSRLARYVDERGVVDSLYNTQGYFQATHGVLGGARMLRDPSTSSSYRPNHSASHSLVSRRVSPYPTETMSGSSSAMLSARPMIVADPMSARYRSTMNPNEWGETQQPTGDTIFDHDVYRTVSDVRQREMLDSRGVTDHCVNGRYLDEYGHPRPNQATTAHHPQQNRSSMTAHSPTASSQPIRRNDTARRSYDAMSGEYYNERRHSGEISQVMVWNVPLTIRASELKTAFSQQIGTVVSADILSPQPGQTSTQAVVTFARRDDVKKAVANFNGGNLNGNIIKLKVLE